MTMELYTVGPVVIFGMVGFIAAVAAGAGIAAEDRTLRIGRLTFRQWAADVNKTSTTPEDWLQINALERNSHFSDCVVSVWKGWESGRVPTLAELHNLSVRRERRRVSARLAQGIGTLLVVTGIALTLWSIHPILANFQIAPKSTGVVESGTRTEAAKTTINQLGEAFMPSLWALGLTVIVGCCRGIGYVRLTNELALKLDQFVIQELFPVFPPRSLGQDLQDIKVRASELIDTLEARGNDLEDLLVSLQKATLGLATATPQLAAAASTMSNAATVVETAAASIVLGLGDNLGPRSEFAIGINTLASLVQGNQNAAEKANLAGEAFAKSAEVVAAAGREISSATKAATADLRKSVNHLPQMIQEAAKEASSAFQKAAAVSADEIVKAGGSIAKAVERSGAEATDKIHQAGGQVAANVIQAGQQTIGDIVAAGKSISEGIKVSAAANVATLTTGVETAAGQAAKIFENSTASLPGLIQQGLAPIYEVAGRIENSHLEADEKLIGVVKKFDHAGQNVLGEFQRELTATTDRISRSFTGAANSVEKADRVSARMEVLLNTFSPNQWWKNARSIFRRRE